MIVGDGRRFFLNDSFYKKGIRLSIASVNTDEIEKGLSIIENTIANLTRESRVY